MKKLEMCPICKEPVISEFAPFCSRYCQNRDLLSWMNEKYTIPVEPDFEDALEDGDESYVEDGVFDKLR